MKKSLKNANDTDKREEKSKEEGKGEVKKKNCEGEVRRKRMAGTRLFNAFIINERCIHGATRQPFSPPTQKEN